MAFLDEATGPGIFDPGDIGYWAELGERMGEQQVAERRARDPNFEYNREVLVGREPPEVEPRIPPPPPPTPRPPVGVTPPTPPGPPAPPTPGLQLPGFPAPQDLMRQIMSMILMENLRKFFGGGLPTPSQFIPGGQSPPPVSIMPPKLPYYPGMPTPPGIIPGPPRFMPTPSEVTQGPTGIPWGPMGAGNAMWSWLSQFFTQPRQRSFTDLLGQRISPGMASGWV